MDKTPLEKQCGLVYEVEYGVCHKQYIGETERNLGKRFNEHTDGNRISSAVQEHIDLTDHPFTFNCITMLHNEDNKTGSRVKEAIEICKDAAALN